MAKAEEDVPVPSGSGGDPNDDELEKFPDDFKKYVKNDLYWMRLKGRSSLCPSWVFDCASRSERKISERSLMLKMKIEHALLALTRCQIVSLPLLVQFWDHITIEGRSFLTTQKRPFALIEFDDKIDKGLCEYRMWSLGYKVYVDGETEEELGPVGRVFRRKLPEATPDVEYYSSKEYPRREHALRCHVTGSVALPVFEPSSQNCVGVLELVTTEQDTDLAANLMPVAIDYAFKALEEVGLKSSKEYSFVQDNNKALTPALNEIKEVLAKFAKDKNDAYEIELVQTWVTWKGCIGVSKILCPFFSYFLLEELELFESASTSIDLGKDHGIVGAALSSHNLLFYTDVAQLSIIEYPLAHYAKLCELSGCFVICLRSSYTENEVYVLKVFLDSPTIEDRLALQTSLCRVLRTLEQFFQTFKLASGEDLGEDLPIDVIDFRNGEKCCYTLQPRTIRTPPRPEALQNEGEMMQLDDPTDQQSMDCVNNGRNVAIAKQNDIALTYSEIKVTKKTKRKHITREDIEKIYEKMTAGEAAGHLDVSRSTLKRLCRRHGIEKWPFRGIRKIMKGNSSRAKLKQVKESVRGAEGATSLKVPFSVPDAFPAAQPENPPGEKLTQDEACQGSKIQHQLAVMTISAQPEASTRGGSTENTVISGTYGNLKSLLDLSISSGSGSANLTPSKAASLQRIQQELQDTLNCTSAKMTIKSTFEGDTIKFQLSSSSGFNELKNEVAKKLNLKSDTFKMKFPDKDKEIILMTSDEDLQEFLEIWKLPGGNAIRLLVERIAN